MENKNKKELSYKAKYKLLVSGSILTTITPLLIVMAINYKVYFTTTNRTKLYIGLVLGLLMIIIVVVNKLKLKRIMWLAIFFGIAVFFESLFKDIVMLSAALLLGGVLDVIFFVSKVKRLEKLIDYKDQADIQGQVQKDVNKELIKEIVKEVNKDRGRV